MNIALHVVPQLIPAGLDVTVPVPPLVEPFVTVSVYWLRVNAALTVAAADIVTVHEPVPEQAPDHPAKFDPDAALALSETTVVGGNDAVHVVPQLMPAGVDVTNPDPDPDFVTVRVLEVSVNVAVTDRAALIVTLHAPVPLHAPDQPANVDPDAGVAVKATGVEATKDALHVVPQLMPAGVDMTEPEPLPVRVTVNG